MRSLVLFVVGLVAAFPAQAQTVAEVEQAWRGWMTKNNRTGGLAILHKGTVLREGAVGRFVSGTPVPLASLSKAVTAVCIATLVEQGRISFETPLSRALERTFARIGPPNDRRLDGVTIAQLLTHRAGFDRNGADPATSTLTTYLHNATARRTWFDERLKPVLRQKLVAQPGERYAYSNSVYQLLGAVVEEVSGQEYEAYCKQAVLAPLGATGAALDPAWRVMSSYGGWRMSLADYGRFYQAFVPGNPAIGERSRRWMLSPAGKGVGTGTHYGLGTDVRPLPGGDANFWHWGRWTASIARAKDGPLHASYSAFAVRWGGIDVNMVTYMTPDVTDAAARADLERVLADAAKAVKRWP